MGDKYIRSQTSRGWVITEAGHDYRAPLNACTFAFDTENFAFIDGVKVDTATLTKLSLKMSVAEKRQRVSSEVWCWQCYDEINGFFMCSAFEDWLEYQARAHFKFGWCYNAKFDFSQIDYKVLTDPKWKRHIKRDGHAYNKAQPWTFDSIHNDMGTRYAYKLWIPYKSKDRHTYCHPVEYRDFMNIFQGGLARMLIALDVKRPDGTPLRKLEMDYQGVNTEALTDQEIEYCRIDVEGLYYGLKSYNDTIEQQSAGERHIFGPDTNIMTAGGFAKAELLRSLYPNISPKKRIKKYQRDHPLTDYQDKWIRKHHLYRGGISVVNPAMQGRLLRSEQFGKPMKRYDVNSEYPYAMSIMRDLIGRPKVESYSTWLKMPAKQRDDYECILLLTSVSASLKPGYVPVWYDPFKRKYVAEVDERGLHLMFEREFDELSHWYDIDYSCDKVLLYRRGECVYAPFVYENYELKAQAKKDDNAALSNVVKLKLNSSYGKLAERVERVVGEYQLNEETGAIHFVKTGEESDTHGMMNVVIGALVTAIARVWILSHIREICKEDEICLWFIYIDTDSIHAFAEYDKADPYTLGGFKEEATCPAVKYLAPKTYFDIEDMEGDYIKLKSGKDGKIKPQIELHTKGVNITSVQNDFMHQVTDQGLPIEYVNKRFDYGQAFAVLCAMNVPGGKVLLPTMKYLARDEQRPDQFLTISTGYDGSFLSEI